MSAYSNLVIADGASNFWRLNEPSGTTAVDIIGGKNGTISGGVTLAQPGALSDGDKAMVFDGSATGNIVVPNGPLNSGTGPITIELWVKTTTVGTFCWLLNGRNNASNVGVAVILDGTTGLPLFYVTSVAGTNEAAAGPRSVMDGQWHHLVAVLTRGTDKAQVFVDGVGGSILTLVTQGANLTPASAPAVYLGNFQFGAGMAGGLDDVAIYPVALSPAQIAAHYTVGKIGKTAPTTYSDRVILDGASNYWRLNEPSGTTAVDVIGGKNGTISGGVTLNQPGALSDGDKAMGFDGSTGKILTGNVTIPLVFTVELWLKSTSASLQAAFATRNNGGTGTGILVAINGGIVNVFTAAGVPGTRNTADGQWHHVVAILTGSTVSIYVDGQSDGSGAQPTTTYTGPSAIGVDGSLGGFFNAGSLDDVAIYPVALSPAQIAAHYTVGKIGKTAPTTYADRVILDGASNYWRLNEPSGTTAVDIIGGKNGTISGGVTLNQPGALGDGDPSMAFNGTTGKVATAAGVIALGTGSVTVEAWCKSSAALTQRFVVDGALEANLNFPGVLIRAMTVPSLNVLVLKGDGTTAVEVAWGTPWTDGAWRHIVGVVSRGAPDQLLLYGNGALIASLPFPTAGWNLTSAQPWCIGNSVASGLPWGGLLDDVAIYPVALSPAQIAAHYQARLLSGSRRPLPAFVLAHRRFPS